MAAARSALPKTALGPIFIVCMGAGAGSIIAMTLAISLIVTILNVLDGFNRTDADKLKLMRTLGAGRLQIFLKLVLPANLSTIVNVLKIMHIMILLIERAVRKRFGIV